MIPWSIAHQGGWDELLLFAGPIVLVLLWVRWAERRSGKRGPDRPPEAEQRTTNLPDDAEA